MAEILYWDWILSGLRLGTMVEVEELSKAITDQALQSGSWETKIFNR